MGKSFTPYVGFSHQFKRFPLQEEDQRKLIDACKDFNEKLRVIILLDTGMRVSEFCNLKKENINWQDGTIKVYGKRGPYGSDKPYRVIPMSDKVRLMLDKYFSVHEDFKEISPRAIQRTLKNVAKRTDIKQKVTPHILRHSFAVNCLKKGINLRTLQLILGHSSIMVTQIYLSLAPQDLIKEFKEKF